MKVLHFFFLAQQIVYQQLPKNVNNGFYSLLEVTNVILCSSEPPFQLADFCPFSGSWQILVDFLKAVGRDWGMTRIHRMKTVGFSWAVQAYNPVYQFDELNYFSEPTESVTRLNFCSS